MKAKNRKMFDYCGKRYGFSSHLIGFMLGASAGFITSEILYEKLSLNIILALIFGAIASHRYVNFLISNRRRQFAHEFCDYLDSISSSFSCGRNTYEAFLCAGEEIKDMYKADSPLYIESARLVDGLKNGRNIEELLCEMAERSGNTDVKIFCDVYSICNSVGGNLKKIVNDTKNTIVEKIDIEAEIQATLAGPKNELKIMTFMPLVITSTLKVFGDQFTGENSLVTNSIALMIFVFAYFIGSRIVEIRV